MTTQDQHLTEAFRTGMRKLVSGVSLITSVDGTRRVGLVATAVSSLSVDPPSLLICVNQQASAHDAIRRSGFAAVNLLRNDDLTIADSFSDSSRRSERFTRGDWKTLKTSAPILETSLVSFDCEVLETFEHHSHTIFVLNVVDVWTSNTQHDALIYANRKYRTIGLQAAV